MSLDFHDKHHVSEPGSGPRTLLLLHGTGGNEHDLLGVGRSLDATASLLSPRGAVLENGMPRYFRRLAEGVFDEEDLVKRTQDLADFVLAAAERYRFDAENVVAVGYSNGANIAGAMLLLRPEILRAAVLLRPMVPLVPKELPNLKGKRVYIGAGRVDPISPPREIERLRTLLERAGAAVRVEFANAGHGLSSGEIDEVRNWLERPGA